MRWCFVGALALLLSAVAVWAQQQGKAPDTGLKVGDSIPSYNPIHVAGPDKGTDTCPP